VPVVAFDLGRDPRRIALIVEPDELARVEFVVGDITDLGSVERALADHAITNVVHLAALQVPFCRADPPLGAQVNVTGTVNVFEAVKRRGEGMAPVVYTGSIGMYSPTDVDASTGRLEEDADAHPGNHYGVYKLANEGSARIYWADSGVPSVGLRPMTVYGAGRDQGMTSSPTAAIAAAVLGVPFRIGFGGRTLFQYAEDVAKTLIMASRSSPGGPRIYNLGGSQVSLDDWAAAIEVAVPEAAGLITVAPDGLPFPSDIAHDRLAELGAVPVTPFGDAIAATAAIYRRLAAEGRLVGAEHGVPAAPAPTRP
jgi:nucleoside-diphosphate-sugar epimerase